MTQTAYVINLDKRPDRWERTQELWSPWFDLVRFPASNTPENGARGCKWSHCLCAHQHLENEQVIIVIEDDAIPAPAWEQIGMDCLDEARRQFACWDYVNCGGHLDMGCIGMQRAILEQTTSPLFLRCSYSHNTHMVFYNHASLRLLNASLRSHLPLDIFLARNAYNPWVPVRLLATQSDSPGNISKPQVDIAALNRLSEQMLEAAVSDVEMAKR